MKNNVAVRLARGAGFACLLFAGVANAQQEPPFSCLAEPSSPPLLRAGSNAELAGVISIRCTGGGGRLGGLTPRVQDVLVTLSAPYAGRLTQAFGGWTEVLLTVDDPTSPILNENVFHGLLVAPNRLAFANVLLPPPASGGERRVRITNIRVAAPSAGSSQIAPVAVQALVSMSRVFVVNPQQYVGFVQSGLRFQLLNPTGVATREMTFASPGSSAYRVRFEEGFAAAFRKRNIATSVATPAATATQLEAKRDYGTESGYFVPTLAATNGADQAGLASQGTRLMATITNIPAGVSLSAAAAPRTDSTSSVIARMVQADESGAGAVSIIAPGPDGRVPLQVVNGTARAVWEVFGSDAAALETLQFDVVATYSGTPSGSATVAGAFAPVSANGTADANLPVPRFGAAAGGAQSGCATDCLLVPSAVSFQYTTGDPAPAAAAIPVRSSGAALSYRVVAVSSSAALGRAPPDANWLQVSPSSGVTPSSVSLSVLPEALTPGLYSAVVNVSSGRFSENIFVLLDVRPNAAAAVIPLRCDGNAGVPPVVRSSGAAERMADLVFNCYSPAPAGSSITTDLRVTLNTPITSRLAGSASDALLLINEPTDYPPSRLPPYDQLGQLGVNMFRGEITGENTVVFRNVQFPTSPLSTTILRIANLHADVSRIGTSGTLTPSTVVATIRASRIAIPQPEQTVAFISEGYTFELTDSGQSRIAGLPVSGTSSPQATLQFREGYATAFMRRNLGTAFSAPDFLRAQNVPGAIYNTETGFYSPAVAGLETAGLATQGTRLLARFANVPAGVRLYVTVTETDAASGTEKARLVRTDTAGAGSYSEAPALPGNPFGAGQPLAAEVSLQSGSGVAVWEVTGLTSIFSVETLRFGLLAVAENAPAGLVTAEGFLAPLSGVNVADAQSPMPRFSSVPPSGALCISCVRVPSSIQLTSSSPSAAIQVTASGEPVVFTAITQNAAWLRVDAGAGVTPAALSVSADITGLAPGNYSGSVVINSTTIPVGLTVFDTSTTEPERASVSLSVDRVELRLAQGGTAESASVRVDGTVGAAFRAVSYTPWLIVTPSSGTVPATLVISVNMGAVNPGEYMAYVSVTAQGGGSQMLPVRVSVTERPQFLPTPAAVTIVHRQGDAPNPVVLYVTSRGRQTTFTAEALSAGNWLSVTPESGMTPVNLRLSYDASRLAAGIYAGSILLTSLDGAGPPLQVPVTLEVR